MKKGTKKYVEITLLCKACPPQSYVLTEMANMFMDIESAKKWETELAERLLAEGYRFIEFEWKYKTIYR